MTTKQKQLQNPNITNFSLNQITKTLVNPSLRHHLQPHGDDDGVPRSLLSAPPRQDVGADGDDGNVHGWLGLSYGYDERWGESHASLLFPP